METYFLIHPETKEDIRAETEWFQNAGCAFPNNFTFFRDEKKDEEYYPEGDVLNDLISQLTHLLEVDFGDDAYQLYVEICKELSIKT